MTATSCARSSNATRRLAAGLAWASLMFAAHAVASEAPGAVNNVVGYYTDIAIGSDSFPVVSHYDATAGALKVAKCANAACTGAATLRTIDTGGKGDFGSIAIGSDGLAVISYRDFMLDALRVAHCGDAACASGNTLTIVDDPAGAVVGLYTSITVPADGRPVISYHDFSAQSLKVAKCADHACTSATTVTVDDPGNSVGLYTSIAISADGSPVISYYDATARALKVAKCANAACTGTAAVATVDDPPGGDVGAYTSIALGSDLLPVISYLDAGANALKVAKCGNPGCSAGNTITTIDGGPGVGSVGAFSAIANGADGRPVVSYYDNSGSLKVAKCANPVCTGAATVSTVDDSFNRVGLYTSITIGADERPVISYLDFSAGALKVARCANTSCTGAATITTVDGPVFANGFEAPLP